MKDEEAIFELEFVRDAQDKQANARAACGALVQEAYKRGSEDNLTVIYVSLAWEDTSAAAAPDAKRRRLDAAEATPSGSAPGSRSLGPGRFFFRPQKFWQEIL